MSEEWDLSNAEAEQIAGYELRYVMGGTPTSQSRNPVSRKLTTGATIWIFYKGDKLAAIVRGTEAEVEETKRRVASGERKLTE
jgi:hypothetical protein